MGTNDLFQKYRSRLVRVGIIKSLLLGLVLGFIVTGIAAFIAYIAKLPLYGILLLGLGLGFVVFEVSFPIIYYKRYRPTKKRMAQTLDGFGLDERVITMCEQEKNNSYIAGLQREDAKTKLKGLSEKRIKLEVSMTLILVLVFSFVFAAGLTTVSALASTDIIHIGLFEEPPEDPNVPIDGYYIIRYYVVDNEGGTIEGETTQSVKEGENGTKVSAVADEGYVFTGWMDEYGNTIGVDATRIEFRVTAHKDIYAKFFKQPDNPGDGSGNDDNPPQEQPPEELPPEEQPPEGDGNGDDGEDEEGKDSRYNNNVIDGKTDYQKEFDRDAAEDAIAKDEELPDELKDILGDYCGGLKP